MKKQRASSQRRSIKTGDLIDLNPHRLLCGSAENENHVKTLVGDDKISLVEIDPPYGVSICQSKEGFASYKSKKPIVNDDITDEDEYKKFTISYLKPIIPHLAKKNSLYMFNADRMILPTIQGIREAGFKFSQLLVWIKSQAVLGRLDYQPQHELIFYGWYGRHEFKKSKDKSVLFCPKVQKSPLHPTMKPVNLVSRLILNSTDINDAVYDCFCGSGTTIIACEQTCRRALAIEIDPSYCETIIKRWERYTGKTAKFIN